MKHVGVTGASGFIGKHLIKQLLESGFSVTVLVRQNESFPEGVKIVKGDLSNVEAVNEFLKDVDILVHLAGRQLPPDEKFFQDNVVASNTLVGGMLHAKVKQAIFLSTIAVYGDQKRGVNEESDECFPTTYYGFTKYLAEKIFQYWSSVSQGKLTILRPFNIYGKGSTKGVVYNLLSNIKQNKQITIYGDGSQSRDFLYVSDVVNAIMFAIDKKATGVFNLGAGKDVTILELVKLLETVTKTNVSIHFEKTEVGKTSKIEYSLKKAKKNLGWEAHVSLEDGLKKLL